MKKCQVCQKEIPGDLFIGRQTQCPLCHADLHCCVNCVYFERGAYNDCRERQAERVLDKSRSNFCDYFRFKDSALKTETTATASKDTLEALFKR
jgi:hypothetical protein